MKKLEITGLMLLGLLFFVWPIPRTISVRDMLLVLILLVFGYLAWRRGWPREKMRALFVPAIILAALTAWMYLVALYISPETSWSLDEIRSQWIRGLVALLAGVSVALAVGTDSAFKQKALLVVFIALMLHILYVDLEALNIWLHDQNLERLAGLTEGPDKSNYLTNLLFCFLLAESFSRMFHKKRTLPFGNVILAAAMVLDVISVIVERTRNGIIVLVIMLLALGALYLLDQRKRLNKKALIGGLAAMLMIVISGVGMVVASRQSSSLNNLLATVSIGWDTEHYKAWQEDGRAGWPTLPTGESVDPSAYQRIAWLKEGLLLFKEHPFGHGFGRNAFGHGLKAKYGEGGGHSHSGLLDFAIGTGIPGTLLWLGFFVSLMRLAWKRSRAGHSHAAILLMLLLLDFGTRMFLDSNIRDHMLQQFMLLAGFASVIMMRETQGKARSSA